MNLTSKQIAQFKKKIYTFYKQNKRDLPWRKKSTPYQVVISEIMLQQTQVPRVMVKYPEFLKKFPNFKALAHAELRDVLIAWQGMGYNRRAKYLHTIAKEVTEKYNGRLPKTLEELQALPGIGPNTAASISAFAFNLPVVFIETNIRSVYIHEFFHDAENIHDKELMPLIEQTLDRENSRDWYNALMDYGTFLKEQHKNPSRKSTHYTKQSKFEGSDRQIRGMILKLLTEHEKLSEKKLLSEIDKEKTRVKKIIDQLIDEMLIIKTKLSYKIK